MSVNIFSDQNKVQQNTFRFKTVGDKIQGTLVGKRVTSNALKGGEDQLVYDLKAEDGSVVSVFGKPGIDFQMKNIKLGQIVGMEYVKDLPPKMPGHSPTHVIQIYADAKVVDEAWIKEQEENLTLESAAKSFNQPATTAGPSFMNTPEPAKTPRGAVEVQPLPPTAPVAPVAPTPVNDVPFQSAPPNKEAQIKDWAKAMIPGTDDTNYTNKVMEATGIPFIPMNYDKILAALGVK